MTNSIGSQKNSLGPNFGGIAGNAYLGNQGKQNSYQVQHPQT